jgi:thiamine-phosphate diphosphorylase
VQLREKDASSAEFYRMALELRKLTCRYGVPFIINDRLDIALAVDADGLHIGQSDMPLEVARRLLGSEKIIGVSASCVEEAKLALEGGADYLGVGAVFPTGTKGDADSVSIDELRRIKGSVDIPVVAIGGINEANAHVPLSAGIDGISVVSAIVASDSPVDASRRLLEIVKIQKL